MTATTLGKRQNIDVGAIEQELAVLWQHEQSDDGPQITRACVMTLITPVLGHWAANEANNVASHLTDRFPNRSIILDCAPHDPNDSMEAWVQANCQLPNAGQSQICCEQIVIEARGAAVARVPGAVLPLLVADVPVIVFWAHGALHDTPLFARLNVYADRVIIDSATFEQPEAQIKRLASLFGERRSLSDLAWARLTAWRELTAQFFDSADTLQQLLRLDHVVIRYHAPNNELLNRMQPLLFVGWLAAKLKWQPVGVLPPTAHASTELRRSDGSTIRVELQAIETAEPRSDQIESIELGCEGRTWTLARAQAPDCAVASAEDGNTSRQRFVHLERADTTALLADELRLLGRDTGYEEAIKAAAAMLS